MKFNSPLVKGTMIKRYKRFLSDIKLDCGEIITAHTANTGSMESCWEPEWPVLLSYHPNSKRKYPYSLEMTHNGQSWIAVNTSITNQIALESLLSGLIPEIEVKEWQSEYTIGQSRLDYRIVDSNFQEIFLEVKNVTLKGLDDFATFPDSVSLRGQKHLQELTQIRKQGMRAAMLYIVPRMDVHTFTPAIEIDPEYDQLLKNAVREGVEIYVIQCHLDQHGITPYQRLPYVLLDESGDFI